MNNSFVLFQYFWYSGKVNKIPNRNCHFFRKIPISNLEIFFLDEFISKMPENPKRSRQLSEALRRPLAYLGIYRSGAFDDDSISLRSYVIMVLMSSYLVLSVAFMALESKTFQSHADCFWITATNMLMFCVVVLLALKRRNLFELIDNFENIIETRKKSATLIR